MTYAAPLLGVLTALFALRVAGQAIQHWSPRSFLPSFDAFQGSALPYWFLLSTQLALLALMTYVTLKVASGRHRMQPRAQRVLMWFGIVYMGGAIARIAVGVAVPAAPAWFSAWLPAFFHVVLAAFVLTLARHHAVRPKEVER